MNSAGRSCALCATLVQVGRDTLTLKEPVTRWHGAAWLHPYCRGTIVVLVPRSADSAASFVAPGIAGSSALPRQLLQPFCCVHMLTQIKRINESESRYVILSSLASRFAFFIPPHPTSSSRVSVYQESTVYLLNER